MIKVFRGIGILLLFAVLAAIRFYESELFYDPLLNFFKSDYLNNITPQFKFGKLVTYTALRFFVNTIVSLGILYIAFRDISILKFASLLYTIFFLILLLIFIGMLLQISDIENYMPLFYIRRFLIQPIFIILLLPAFYYYKKHQ